MSGMAQRIWPGETVVCIATGPSLTHEDVASVRGRARVIAVNDAYQLAPWADCLYAADGKWWRWHQGVPGFAGLKFSINERADQNRSKLGAVILKNAGRRGLSLSPTGLTTGSNSGYQAINLAVHFGAQRIVLLGYDMRGRHFFGEHPDKTVPPFDRSIAAFATLVAPLALLGVEVVNCTPNSALTCFPTASLRECLPAVAA